MLAGTENRLIAPSSPGSSLVQTKSPTSPTTFIVLQGQMESELERRRKEWEMEVEKMQEDFFQTKINNTNIRNSNVHKNIDVQVSPALTTGTVALSNGTSKEIIPTKFKSSATEIGHAKTRYEEKPDGTTVVKFEFDMREFDPRSVSVRVEGARLLVSARLEEEYSPGNKRSRQLNRQVDIPPNVYAEDFTSKMSAQGILTIEAPYDEPLSPTVPPPAYNALENEDVYFVTRSNPTQSIRRASEIPKSSPFMIEKYKIESDMTSNPMTSPNSIIDRRYSVNTYRKPEVKLTRIYSDYKDPGPLLPHSRGEILRNESPKNRIHHSSSITGGIPTRRSSYMEPRISATEASFEDHSLTSSGGIEDNLPRRLSLIETSRKSYSDRGNVNNKAKPKVTIIREYENNANETIATSPPVRTSVFREYRTSPLLNESSENTRERMDSTSSGEKIIYPTKYKKQMSMSQSSDSENSSLSTSPPSREFTARPRLSMPQLSPNLGDTNVVYPASPSSPFERNNINLQPSTTTTKRHSVSGYISPQPQVKQHPMVISTEEGQRLRVNIELGSNYTADEVTVYLRYRKLIIQAVHEESVGGHSARSEFSRDVDLPAPLEPATVRAALTSDGRLHVGGSMMTNKRHDSVLDLVLCDMPTDARACNVKY